MQPIQIELNKKLKPFPEFFFCILEIYTIFKILKKMMTIIAYPLPKLQITKN